MNLSSLSLALTRAGSSSLNIPDLFGTDTLWHFGTPDDWWSAYQLSRGPEGVAGGFVTPAGYNNTVTQIGSRSFTAAGDGDAASRAACPVNFSVVAGRTYIFKFRLNEPLASGNLQGFIRTGATAGGGSPVAGSPMRSAADVYYVQYTATFSGAINLLFVATVVGVGFSVSDVSIREIDLSKIQLWQDPAGTLAVTGPGQTWGLLLDAANGLARGPELVVNGGFTADTDWTKGTGWTIGSGVATKTAGTASDLAPAVALVPVATRHYEISYTVTVTAGTLTPSFGGTTGTARTTSGTYREILKATNTNSLAVNGNDTFDGTIDNISVKELPGYHASQPGAPSRPLFTCRYNQLQRTEDFNDSTWVKSGTGVATAPVVTPNAAVAPDGTLTADLVVFDLKGGTALGDMSQIGHSSQNAVAGTSEVESIWLRTSDGSTKQVNQLNVCGQTQLITVTPEWQQFIFASELPTTVTAAPCRINIRGTTGTSSSASLYMWGAQRRLSIHANIGKPYQRVTTATDMDQDGFPFYSRTDGIDDWASTPVIPLGTMGVSAVTVATGVTKLSDAEQAILAEFSANSTTTAGTLGIMAPSAAAAADFRSQSGGSVPGIAATVGSLAAPRRGVLVAEGSIATDVSRLTVNNGTPVLTATDQGTGTYTDQIMYLFRRGGTELPFGGYWHGSTGVKRLLTDSEKRNLSAYYNRNVRGY